MGSLASVLSEKLLSAFIEVHWSSKVFPGNVRRGMTGALRVVGGEAAARSTISPLLQAFSLAAASPPMVPRAMSSRIPVSYGMRDLIQRALYFQE